MNQTTLVESPDFYEELETLLNRFGWDNRTNTPDFILAKYVEDFLGLYEKQQRDLKHWRNG